MKRLALAMLCGLLLVAAPGRPGSAQASVPFASAPNSLSPAPALTQADAEAWLDGIVPYALRRGGIPGAVVVIVKDHRILLEKGYGLADIATGRAVDPRKTLFRIGSISKLFTWTAVMQLVEQHRIDLDADINHYLDFQIPHRNGRPVTMRDLMTHRAGFEEAVRGIATLKPDSRVALGAALSRWVPTRIYDPGTTPAYSNYGAAVAGYIVQRVSHEPFEAYVARHILQPLRMTRSTFAQPVPAALRDDLSRGYADSDSEPGAFETVIWSPAGGISTTGDDMAHFMIANLDQGRFGAAQILRPQTAALMQNTVISSMPPLNGMDLGFYETNINGREVIGHDGDTVLFHAMIRLYRKGGVGLFVALNAAGRDDANHTIRTGLFEEFSDRYFPVTAAAGAVPWDVTRSHTDLFTGSYASSRRPFSSFLAGAFLLGQVNIERHDDGTISVNGLNGLSGAPRRFRETSPFLWSEVGGHDRIAVKIAGGRIVAFADDESAPTEIYQSVPTFEAGTLLFPAAGSALLVIGITLLAWPIAALVRRRYGVILTLSNAQIRARRLGALFNGLALVASGGWVWVLTLLGPPNGIYLLDSHALGIHSVQLLSILSLPGGLLSALYSLAVKRRAGSPSWSVGWGLLLVLAFVTLLWTGWIARLLNLSLQF